MRVTLVPFRVAEDTIDAQISNIAKIDSITHFTKILSDCNHDYKVNLCELRVYTGD